jgi:hypothetical protein
MAVPPQDHRLPCATGSTVARLVVQQTRPRRRRRHAAGNEAASALDLHRTLAPLRTGKDGPRRLSGLRLAWPGVERASSSTPAASSSASATPRGASRAGASSRWCALDRHCSTGQGAEPKGVRPQLFRRPEAFGTICKTRTLLIVVDRRIAVSRPSPRLHLDEPVPRCGRRIRSRWLRLPPGVGKRDMKMPFVVGALAAQLLISGPLMAQTYKVFVNVQSGP